MSVFTHVFVLVLSVVRLDLSILLVLEYAYYLVQTYTPTNVLTSIYLHIYRFIYIDAAFARSEHV